MLHAHRSATVEPIGAGWPAALGRAAGGWGMAGMAPCFMPTAAPQLSPSAQGGLQHWAEQRDLGSMQAASMQAMGSGANVAPVVYMVAVPMMGAYPAGAQNSSGLVCVPHQ